MARRARVALTAIAGVVIKADLTSTDSVIYNSTCCRNSFSSMLLAADEPRFLIGVVYSGE
jgi:hypothetical protein